MPSKSKAQHNLMAAVANNPSFAKKVGIPQSVGKDFSEADKGRKFGKGGFSSTKAKINKQNTRHGKYDLPFAALNKYAGMAEGGDVNESKAMMKKEVSFMKKKGAPKSMLKHEMAEMRGKKFAEGGDVEDDTDAEGYGTKIERIESKPQTFKQAFAAARANGEKTFPWNGKRYTTELAKPKTPGEKSVAAWETAMAYRDASNASKNKPGPSARGSTQGRRIGRMYLSDDTARKFGSAMAPGSKEPERDTTYDKFGKTMASGYRGGGSINQKGGSMRGYARGGGIESRGKTKGTMVKMASGGAVFRKAADGIASKGKTKGTMVKMAYGGKC